MPGGQPIDALHQDSDDIDDALREVAQVEKFRAALRKKYIEQELKLEEKAATKSGKARERLVKKLTNTQVKHAEQSAKAEERALKDRQALSKRDLHERLQEERELHKEALEASAKYGDNIKTRMAAAGELFKEQLKDSLKGIGKSIGEVLKNANSAAEEYMGLYTRYQARLDARLQGATSFKATEKLIRDRSFANPFFRYTDVMENLDTLIGQGIADNVAQRAFLNTIKDKIATTFDAAESSLLQIVRIQQRDSTAARLGMEADLTQLFNSYFGDTSYLSKSYDSIQDTLIALSAGRSRESSISTEYQIQKWLGALGSVGVSDSTLSTIASGIVALGTGNINELSSNTSLQNLLVMASNRAGLEYGTILNKGLSDAQANVLLASIIEYVKEIAQSDNNVVKAQFAQLFGVTIADLSAFQNIEGTVIKKLRETSMSYTNALDQVDQQMRKAMQRTPISELIDNVMQNALAAAGTTVASNIGLYSAYTAMDMLQKNFGDIFLPTVGVVGNYLDLHMSLQDLSKSLIVGIGTVGSLIGALGSIGKGGLTGWRGWETSYSHGTGYTGYKSKGTINTGRSITGYAGNSSDVGVSQSISDSGQENAEEISNENYNPDEGKDIDDNVKSILELLQHVLSTEGVVAPTGKAFTVINSTGLTSGTPPFPTSPD